MAFGIDVNSNTRADTRPSTQTSTGTRVDATVPSTRVDTSRQGQSSQVSTSHGASQAVADANRQVAESQREAAEQIAEIRRQEQERLRNEQLHRGNDARIAEEARKSQSERTQPDMREAAGLAATTRPASTQAAAQGQQAAMSRPSVPVMSVDDVMSSTLSRQVPSSPTDARINELIGDEWNDMRLERERADRYDFDLDDAAQQIVDSEMQRDDIARTTRRVGAEGRAMEGHVPVADQSQLDDALPRVPREQSTRDVFDNYVSYTRERIREGQAERDEQRAREREERIQRRIDREASNDEPTSAWTDVTGAKTERQMVDRIIEDASSRHRAEYESVRNRDADVDLPKGSTAEQIADAMDSQDEPSFMRSLKAAQNAMMRRFLNPYSLRIEGMGVETRQRDGKTEARIAYSERVNQAIGMVRRLYNCSEYNVLQLVQLRAGIGVGIDGTIANVDPDEFQLTEDQFWQICRDIARSQADNGNPLGPVRGTPGGVRDDTGRFVVVAGTRCFPLGYMPRQLIEDISAHPLSSLHDTTERQLQTMVGNQWLNQTYPQLVANTGGRLAYQARAIENMMRGIMAMDGMNPADLDIPEAQYNRTIMQMRVEQGTVGEPSLRRAIEEKDRRVERDVSHWYHMMRKSGGSRDGGARIASASDRRRNRLGDVPRGLSNLTKMSKAANIFLWVTSPIEAGQAMMEQGIGNNVYDFFLYHGRYENEMRDYTVTDRLDEVARSDEAIEALDVANTLYRIGGNSAVTAFMETLDGEDGRRKYQMTKADMTRFLQDSGVIGDSPGLIDKARQVFGVKEGQENAFLANARAVVNMAENTMLSTSDIFRESQSRQFVKMSMAEMGRAMIHGRESYTSSQVEEWSGLGGAEMVRSLLMTDAGHEAFMTQGVTSLGRKSPLSHVIRRVMTKNGVTELAVRTMFDRFPEYGMAKIERQIPFSNTMSYLASYHISNAGDMLAMQSLDSGRLGAYAVGEEMSRARDYQMGGTMEFWEGLRKNILYDTVMAGNKLAMAALYKGLISMLGGIRRPPDGDDDDEYNWSEWLIGDGENAMPIKWAWYMDDLSGVSLPLGTAWAIAEQGGYSPESVATAANVFINAMANLNSGTALFDAIDLVNNFDMNVEDAMGKPVGLLSPGWDQNLSDSIAIGFWELFGDLTPTVVGQILPWSKDSLFRTDDDARTGSYVYDTENYTLEEAIAGNHVKYVEDESERRLRNAVKYNPLAGLLIDMWTGADKEGRSYRYTMMPIDTMADDLYKASWDRFYLDLSTDNPEVPTDLDDRKRFVYDWAEDKIGEIMSDYGNNPTKAAASGLVLNSDARAAIKAYCNHMLYDVLPDRKDEEIDNAYLKYGKGNIPDNEWDRIGDFYDSQYDYYRTIRDEWMGSDSPIPWSIPRYKRQESDWETRYVDADQNASSYLNYALNPAQRTNLRNAITGVSDMLGLGEYGEALAGTITDEQASPQRYAYGNRPNFMPVASPRTGDKGYNYETIPVWAVTDENGDLVVDLQDVYDMAGGMVAQSGRNEGKNLRELFWAGQGTNMGPDADEELHLGASDVPTLGSSTDGRVWYAMDEKVPDVLQKVMDGDEDTINQILGFDMPTKDKNDSKKDDEAEPASGLYDGGSYYSYGGGGGGYYYSGGGSSSYNPRIYSSPRQVYSQRASGLSTRSPYKPTSTYLRPSFYTSGSRMSYKRQQ